MRAKLVEDNTEIMYTRYYFAGITGPEEPIVYTRRQTLEEKLAERDQALNIHWIGSTAEA